MKSSSQQDIRILHVDDDPAFTDLTETFLKREDDRFAIETAMNADKGIQKLCDNPPDCVVSDYNMPGTDGIEFLQTVREEYPDLPFILFTGKGSEDVASEAIAANVTDYLQKGSGSDKYELLTNRIRNAVQARREVKRANRQEQLMRLTEFAGDTGGFQLETDTGEVILTDGACRILNLPEQANPDFEKNLQHYHPDDREELRRTIQQALQTGKQTQGTFRYEHPDADEKILDITYIPVAGNKDTTTIRGSINDITDRQNREQELQQLQEAIDNANVPITLADPSQDDDPLVYVNDGFEEMTGYPPEETLGRNCRFLQGEDTDPEKVAALREAISNEETISLELRNYRKDGTEFWNHLTVTPVYDGDDQLVRYLGTQEDVTERKERERELTQTRNLMSNMEQLADTGAWEYDPESETLSLTEGVRRVHDLDSGANLTLEATAETLHPDDRDLFEDRLKTCLETGEPYEMDVRLTTSDGEQRWITVQGEHVTDNRDNSVVREYVQDITERQERKKKLELVETLFEYAEECQFIIDVADGNFELRHANRHYKQTVGLPTDAPVTGQTPVELFGETGGQQTLDRYKQCVETQDSVSYTIELPVPKEGTVYRAILAPVSISSEVTHIVGTARDITEQKKYKQELETQNERLDEFTGIVSHDLRSPLSVAEGHLKLVRDPSESEHIRKASNAIERCQALIEDLLTLAQGGDQVSKTDAVVIANVAEKCRDTVETAAVSLNIEAPRTVEADRSRLMQLLENLYCNAVEHSDDEVTVSVDLMTDGFAVADTGPGIPESDREDIFQAGYSTNKDGTGFGLRIVKEIANAHGWEVAVTESEQGGARFEFSGVQFID